MSTTAVVIAIDAGTTGIRSRAVYADGSPSVSAYQEFTQYFPTPGWVEHDANEIWQAVHATLSAVIAQVNAPIAAIGITNQRETVLAWDKLTGKPYGKAIVWQDRRTADRCGELASELPLVRAKTGLVLDPYFSGSKMEWLLVHGNVPNTAQLALGTIDSWIIWNLTQGAAFVTDASNASRTMLFDITAMKWSPELCSLFGVPMRALPTVVASSGRAGVTAASAGIPAGIPISGIAGDQQAALFGQACFETGSSKNTYGTGSFVLMNVGTTCPQPTEGMLTTVAWDLGTGETTYALEGAIFVTGSAIQWLRDGINIIDPIGARGFRLQHQNAELFAHPLDRHAQEGGINLFPRLWHKAKALFGRRIGRVHRLAQPRHTAHQAFAQLHAGFVDGFFLQAFCRAKFQRFGIAEQVDRAHLGPHRIRNDMGDTVKPILALGGRAQHVAQTAQKLSAIAFTAFGHREPLVCRLRVSYKRFAAQKGMQIVKRALWRG